MAIAKLIIIDSIELSIVIMILKLLVFAKQLL